MQSSQKPTLHVTAFSDYICPFCYIGSERLLKLRADYDLKIYWLLVEIHPETPAAGMPVEQLGYAQGHWRGLMDSLMTLAAEEGLSITKHAFTTNSHRALLLAEAVKRLAQDRFYTLHHRLFEAFFTEGMNIGDEAILATLAGECGIPDDVIQAAWQSPRYEQCLAHNRQQAIERQLSGVPTYQIGDQMMVGVPGTVQLQTAARDS